MEIDQWLARCNVSLAVFASGLSYWPQSQTVRGCCGRDNATLCHEMPFLGSPVPDCQAEQRALGLLSPSGEECALPDVIYTRTAALDVHLTEEMIPGSKLPDVPWPPGFNPTLETLMTWVRTREGMPLLSGWNKPAVMKAVKDKILVEMGMRERGERIPLRDPAGRSLVDHVISTSEENQWHFVEDSADSVQLPVSGWCFAIQDIGAVAPSVDQMLIKQHWEHKLTPGAKPERSIFDDAFSRVAEVTRLVHFGYHTLDGVELVPGGSSTDKTVLFKWRAPASWREKVSYTVWAECKVSNLQDGMHPFVCKIKRCGCECPLRHSADCVHLLMLMGVIHTLPRPDDLNIQKPCTSRRCEWLNPGDGDMYSVMTPLYKLPFLRQGMLPGKKKKKKQQQGTAVRSTTPAQPRRERYCSARCTEGMRHQFTGLSTKHEVQLGNVDDPDREGLRERFFAALRNAVGEPSAAEVTWGRKYCSRAPGTGA